MVMTGAATCSTGCGTQGVQAEQVRGCQTRHDCHKLAGSLGPAPSCSVVVQGFQVLWSRGLGPGQCAGPSVSVRTLGLLAPTLRGFCCSAAGLQDRPRTQSVTCWEHEALAAGCHTLCVVLCCRPCLLIGLFTLLLVPCRFSILTSNQGTSSLTLTSAQKYQMWASHASSMQHPQLRPLPQWAPLRECLLAYCFWPGTYSRLLSCVWCSSCFPRRQEFLLCNMGWSM